VDGGSNPRVAFVFPGALGDLVLAMPTLAALRARHAGAHVTLVVAGWLQALAVTSGVADRVASLDAADAVGLFGGERMPPWILGRPRLYAWLGGRDAGGTARLRALASDAHVDAVVRGDGAEHAATVYARLAGVDAPAPFAWPRVPASLRIERTLARLGRPLLAVHGGAGSAAKRWACEGFRDVASRWRAEGGDVIELVGPADGAVAPIAAARLADATLPEVCALLGSIDAYLGNDSGVTHLAAAAGATGIAVYGPTAARRWAPFGGRVIALQAERCGADGIGTDALPAERVWASLRSTSRASGTMPPPSRRRSYLDKVRGRE
jgi:ADP-heptose:LPS heptosyltransferase